ncbi:hypothetical protein ACHAXS_003889 [Conticribra weissflogii]
MTSSTLNEKNINNQTTLLIGGSNGTATLISILCDKSNPRNAGHVVRVATRSAAKYLENDGDGAKGGSATRRPRTWRCHEKKHLSDVVSSDLLPVKLVEHVGRPDGVFVYGREEGGLDGGGGTSRVTEYGTAHGTAGGTELDSKDDHGMDIDIAATLSPLEKAISGIGSHDNGGVADLIVLCCPVSAHLALLRRVARALYRLDELGLLGPGNDAKQAGGHSSQLPPILIGSLYGAGGFDWMSRIAFLKERPPGFSGQWRRPLGLFCLKAFPYLTKSLQAGEVTLHGRYPQIQAAISPSNAAMRRRAKVLLDRLLQNDETGKRLEFLGLSSKEELGGDGTCADEELVWRDSMKAIESHVGAASAIHAANSARNAVMLMAAQTRHHATTKSGASAAAATATASVPPPIVLSQSGHHPNAATPSQLQPPPSPLLDLLTTPTLSDAADPSSALAFLTCTLNSTNQILHPCILVALFRNPTHPHLSDADGTISWNPKRELTPLPRFYADGAAKPEAGRLITAIAGGEMYFVIDALERLICPRGYDPITALHGGEPVGRRVMNFLGNSPHDLGERSGLTDFVLRREWRRMFGGSNDIRVLDVAENEDGDNPTNSRQQAYGAKPNLIRREALLSKLMSYGLSHNARLNAVLSPCIVVQPSNKSESESPSDTVSPSNPIESNTNTNANNAENLEEGTILIKPDTSTRFFSDDVQHGLCIYLGLAELLGFDLERDMKVMLYVVRRLQRWMGKEFVLPESYNYRHGDGIGNGYKNGTGQVKIVAHAKDLAETSAPQAFGVETIGELKRFLELDVFGERRTDGAEGRLMRSGLISKL